MDASARAAAPPPEHVVSADGTRIAYRRLGRGPALVALHGGLGSWRSWEAVARLLADRCELFLVDRRGRGDSGDGPGAPAAADAAPGAAPRAVAHSLADEVADTRAVLQVAGPGAALLGHSYGGVVALETARAAAPGELRALLLYEPAVGVGGAISAEQLAALNQCVIDGVPEQAVPLSMDVLDEAGLVTADGPLARLKVKPTPAFRRLAATVPREIGAVAGLGPGHIASCGAIALPTLLLIGTQSPPRAQANCRELAAVLPDVTVAQLDGLGHVAHTTAPARVAAEIATFLEAHEDVPATRR